MITRIVETCFLIFLSVMLLKWSVAILEEIRVPILVILLIVTAIVIGWRVYKHFRDLGKW